MAKREGMSSNAASKRENGGLNSNNASNKEMGNHDSSANDLSKRANMESKGSKKQISEQREPFTPVKGQIRGEKGEMRNASENGFRKHYQARGDGRQDSSPSMLKNKHNTS